jgi:hypothetical protein
MLSCTFSHLSSSFDWSAIASRTNKVYWDDLDLALALTLGVMVIAPRIPPTECGFIGTRGSANNFGSHELDQPHYGDFTAESRGSDLEPYPPKDHLSVIPRVISLGYQWRTGQREMVTVSSEPSSTLTRGRII